MKKFEKAEKFHSLMQEHELDIILVMSPENVFYTTGAMINSSRLIPERLTICIWPALDPPTFLVCDLEKQVAEKESWVKDICLYNEFSQGPIGALVDILKKRGIREGRIGVEGRFLTKRFIDQITAAMPNVQLVSCDEVFDILRMKKMSIEIERLEEVSKILDAVIMRTVQQARPGMTEREIGTYLLKEAISQGEARFSFLRAYMASGPNAHITHYSVGERSIEQGDLFRLGCGAIYQGYHAIVVRTGTVGSPTQQQLKIYEDLHSIHAEVIHNIRPGTMGKDLYHLSKVLYEERGYNLELPHIGHSVGLSLQEQPKFHPHSDVALSANMTCVVVHFINSRRFGKFYLEDLILVTEQGAVELSRPSGVPELIEIG